MDKNEKARQYSVGKSSASVFREAHERDFLAGYNQCEQDNDKLKQEHAEMQDMLRIVSSRLHNVGFPRLKSGVDDLLNKIKENGN